MKEPPAEPVEEPTASEKAPEQTPTSVSRPVAGGSVARPTASVVPTASDAHSNLNGVESLIRSASNSQRNVASRPTPATSAQRPSVVPRPAPAPRPTQAAPQAPARPAPAARPTPAAQPVGPAIQGRPAPIQQSAPQPAPAKPAASGPVADSNAELRDFLRGKTVTEAVASADGGFEVSAGTVIDDALLDRAEHHDAILMLAVSVDA